MRDRKVILKDILLVNGDLLSLDSEISLYPWDCQKPLLKVQKEDLIVVFSRCIRGDIKYDKLVHWANLIECRDDIEFQQGYLQEIIFEIANPEINGKMTKKRLNEIKNLLEKG